MLKGSPAARDTIAAEAIRGEVRPQNCVTCEHFPKSWDFENFNLLYLLNVFRIDAYRSDGISLQQNTVATVGVKLLKTLPIDIYFNISRIHTYRSDGFSVYQKTIAPVVVTLF